MSKNESDTNNSASKLANKFNQAVRDSKIFKENLESLDRIKEYVELKPESWLQEFNQASGFQVLEKILVSLNQEMQLQRNIRLECMKGLKRLTRHDHGKNEILETKCNLDAIASAIDFNDTSTMAVACLILAALAFSNHEKVLTAIGNHRFSTIVESLTQQNDSKSLKTKSLTLISSLIFNASSDCLKISLKNDFNRCGLITAIEKIKTENSHDKPDLIALNSIKYLEDIEDKICAEALKDSTQDKMLKTGYIFSSEDTNKLENTDSRENTAALMEIPPPPPPPPPPPIPDCRRHSIRRRSYSYLRRI